MVKIPRQYSRGKRKEQVINQFRVWRMNSDSSPKTMQRIARALGMIPSTDVKDMLLELVDEGKLTFEWRDQSGRYTTRFYLLAETTLITEKYFKRHISVRSRGQVVGQMELWS